MRATDIPIASPCEADWRSMKPGDNKRFCDTCRKHVHDLSSMTVDSAHALLASPPTEGLCVRYLYDAHGDVVFRPAPLAPSLLVRARRVASRAAAVALPMTLAACSASLGEPPQPMMGSVSCPAPVPSATAPAIMMGEVVATPPVPLVQEVMGEPPALPPPVAPHPVAPTK